MSKCPYKFALHSGVIYDNDTFVKNGYSGITLVSYNELIKAYDLNPQDCISWNDKYRLRAGGAFADMYVHLHPVNSGDYATELIKAILKYEAIAARRAAAKKETEKMSNNFKKKNDELSHLIDNLFKNRHIFDGRMK